MIDNRHRLMGKFFLRDVTTVGDDLDHCTGDLFAQLRHVIHRKDSVLLASNNLNLTNREQNYPMGWKEGTRQ